MGRRIKAVLGYLILFLGFSYLKTFLTSSYPRPSQPGSRLTPPSDHKSHALVDSANESLTAKAGTFLIHSKGEPPLQPSTKSQHREPPPKPKAKVKLFKPPISPLFLLLSQGLTLRPPIQDHKVPLDPGKS
jgi:hypothetical protein